jgi:hypothetical protein
MVERNMCDAVMRGIVVPPGSVGAHQRRVSVAAEMWRVRPRFFVGVRGFAAGSRIRAPSA